MIEWLCTSGCSAHSAPTEVSAQKLHIPLNMFSSSLIVTPMCHHLLNAMPLHIKEDSIYRVQHLGFTDPIIALPIVGEREMLQLFNEKLECMIF